jgi:ribosome-associated protein
LNSEVGMRPIKNNPNSQAKTEIEDEDLGLSKSETKKAMERLQALGERLADLNASQLDKLPITERLRAALDEYKRLKAHEARRRQRQLIGKLMREEDEEAILTAINPWQNPALSRQIDMLVDRLVTQGDTVVSEILQRFPAAERHTLRQHVRAAQKEAAVIVEKELPEGTENMAKKKLAIYLREVAALS